MKLRRIILGSVLFVALAVASLWVAGATFIFRVFGLQSINTSTPLSWIEYFVHYRDDPSVGGILLQSGLVGLLVFALVLLLTLFLVLRENNGKQKQHGDARFANHSEIKKSGLLGSEGIIVGKHKKQTLKFPGNEFVLLAAPTRGGKGVSVVIPNALAWSESLVVMDVKGENQEITSKYRQSIGQEVYCFNPFDPEGKTHRYNPLDYVRREERYSYGDLTKLAVTLFPEDGEHGFFQRTAQSLFVGLGLLLIETPEMPVTIGQMLKVASGKEGVSAADYIVSIMEERRANNQPLTDKCTEALSRFVGNDERTLANILQTFSSPLTLFGDSMIDAATSHSDFKFTDLRKKKMTIYIGIPVNRMDEAKVLVNMFWSQLISSNTEHLPSKHPELKYKVALLMDEFVLMGRLGVLAKGAAFIAGYNLRLISIVQSPQQLYARPPEGYGESTARAFISNHSCKLLFTPDEQSDADALSKMLGTYTFKARSKNIVKNKSINIPIEKGGSVSDQSRALMLPQELREMSFDEQIIMLKGHKPIKCEKVKYYSDPVYMDMIKSVSPSLSKINKLPSEQEFMNAWAKGELMVDVPPLDLNLIEAKKYNATKSLSIDELNLIDGEEIAVDAAELLTGLEGSLSTEQADRAIEELAQRLENMHGVYTDGTMQAEFPKAYDAEPNGLMKTGYLENQSSRAIDTAEKMYS